MFYCKKSLNYFSATSSPRCSHDALWIMEGTLGGLGLIFFTVQKKKILVCLKWLPCCCRLCCLLPSHVVIAFSRGRRQRLPLLAQHQLQLPVRVDAGLDQLTPRLHRPESESVLLRQTLSWMRWRRPEIENLDVTDVLTLKTLYPIIKIYLGWKDSQANRRWVR